MSLEKPKVKKIFVMVYEQLKAEPNAEGKWIPKRGPSKGFTVYGSSRDEVLNKIKGVFKQ